MQDDADLVASLHTTYLRDTLKELRIILLGKTGTGMYARKITLVDACLLCILILLGKSSLGNLICGCDVFETDFGTCSVTQECHLKQRVFGGRLIKVIDTPGFFDTLTRQKENHGAIAQSLQSSHPGPHAFLVVFRPGRLTIEERACVQKIKDIFGPNSLNYCIFILTHGDEMARRNVTFEKYLEKDPFLKNDLLPQFKNRYMVVDNTIPATDERNRQVVKDLLGMILDLVAINNYTCLQNGLIQKVSDIIHGQEAFGKFNLAEPDGSIVVIPEIMDEVITYNYGDEHLDAISSSNINSGVAAIPEIVDEVVTYDYGNEQLHTIPSSSTNNRVSAMTSIVDEVVRNDYQEEELHTIPSSSTNNRVGATTGIVDEIVTNDYQDEDLHTIPSSSTKNRAGAMTDIVDKVVTHTSSDRNFSRKEQEYDSPSDYSPSILCEQQRNINHRNSIWRDRIFSLTIFCFTLWFACFIFLK
ncbi:unnamed protein product [Rotaria sp. Silwood1]|nr:unnamed protein product [Rotaria sp. Silwood1]